MVMLFLEHVPSSLRGELTRWMIEPKAGVFVGNISAMVREKLWEYIINKTPDCAVLMLHGAKTEQGFVIRSYGDPTRKVQDFEGVALIQRPCQKKEKNAIKEIAPDCHQTKEGGKIEI